MLDRPEPEKLKLLLNTLYDEQSDCERVLRCMPIGTTERALVERNISRSVHACAFRIACLIGENPQGWQWAAEQLRRHPVHAQFLLQSDLLAYALEKPHRHDRGFGLMLMLCRKEERGSSLYATLQNNVYQSLPAAEAIRQATNGVERILRHLPRGAKMLGLDCGPALEVQQVLHDGSPSFEIDLLHHDQQAFAYTRSKITHDSVCHINNCAPEWMDQVWAVVRHGAGKSRCQKTNRPVLQPSSYDLIYAPGFHEEFASDAAGLGRRIQAQTEKMFGLLKPGGRLITGSFLAPGGANPNQSYHRLIMETFTNWKLNYRTQDEVRTFASAIPRSACHVEMLDESLERPVSPGSVIAFLSLTRQGAAKPYWTSQP